MRLAHATNPVGAAPVLVDRSAAKEASSWPALWNRTVVRRLFTRAVSCNGIRAFSLRLLLRGVDGTAMVTHLIVGQSVSALQPRVESELARPLSVDRSRSVRVPPRTLTLPLVFMPFTDCPFSVALHPHFALFQLRSVQNHAHFDHRCTRHGGGLRHLGSRPLVLARPPAEP